MIGAAGLGDLKGARRADAVMLGYVDRVFANETLGADIWSAEA
jgi:hypothetical protein